MTDVRQKSEAKGRKPGKERQWADSAATAIGNVDGGDGVPDGIQAEQVIPMEESTASPQEMERLTPSKPFPIVGVGASAGGLDAFTELMKALPLDTGMAFVLVQHMDPTHESMLNRLLSKQTGMPVAQVTSGMEVEQNHVYVIPPNSEMTIRGGVLQLVARPGGKAGQMPIDTFLTALAQDQKGAAIAVILSGIGSDGTLGCKAIKAEGGITFAQDEASCKFSGMPLSAIASGCVDRTLPPALIAQELSRTVNHPFLRDAKAAPPPILPGEKENGNFSKILRFLRSASGVDFSYYKPNTIRRRIARRMVLQRAHNLPQYVRHMEEHPDEAVALFEDILIHVTGFFREPEVFRALQEQVFPKITRNLSAGEPIRIWIPGCSTGEEVYSVGIALFEYLGDLAGQARIQIFGTDISSASIEKARVGIYPEAVLSELPERRLNRFFSKVEGGYQVSKGIRDMCIFARHDLAKDPPFSKLDLISCRNVLIYLGSILQKRVISIFHYALKADGFLLLGKSETLGSYSHLFNLDDRKHKIYTKKETPTPALPDMMSLGYQGPRGTSPSGESLPGFDLRKEAERIVLDRYAPPGFFVDDNLHVMHFQGDVAPFLKMSSGQPSFELVKLLKPELLVEVRRAIGEAKKNGSMIRRTLLDSDKSGVTRDIGIEVIPVRGRHEERLDFLVLFMAPPKAEAEPASVKERISEPHEQEVGRLHEELNSTRDYLRTVIEDSEASTEELRAANEEILSSNEELQSTNEELETAKEELQSANEELTTLNEELHNRNTELTQLANDLNNVLVGVDIPIIILDKNRRIRRFTPAAERIFNLIRSDIGRPVGNIKSNIEIPDLDQLISLAIKNNERIVEREVQDQDGRWHLLQLRPYAVAEGEEESFLVILMDVDSSKRASAAVVNSMHDSLVVVSSESRVVSANPAFYDTFRLRREEVENRSLFEIGSGKWDIPGLRQSLRGLVTPQSETTEAEVEVQQAFPTVGRKVLSIKLRQLRPRAGQHTLLMIIQDLTEAARARKEIQAQEGDLRENERKLRALTAELISSSEKTSKKVARELHDAFTHGLLALSMRLAEMEKESSGEQKRKMRALSQEARKIATAIQEFSRGFHPAVLEELGLAESLRTECASFAKRSRVSASFNGRGVSKAIPDEIALCLYRIAQEALRNIAEHSRAKYVTMALSASAKEVNLKIADDGRGFDLPLARKRGGLGLISMEERCRLVGGNFAVISEPGRGTVIECSVPLSPRSESRTKEGEQGKRRERRSK